MLLSLKAHLMYSIGFLVQSKHRSNLKFCKVYDQAGSGEIVFINTDLSQLKQNHISIRCPRYIDC